MTADHPAQQPFNICHITAIFADVAELLRHGLSELGHVVHASPANLIVGCRNIVFGAHLLQDFSMLPDDSIIFNLEQMGSGSPLLKPGYLEALRRFTVWDYSPRNIAWLAQQGIPASLVRLGHAPALARVPRPDVQDIDVLFYGVLNPRRQAVIDRLETTGLRVVVLTSVVLAELDTYIARSKVVVNVHYYETKIFEIVRVSYLLNNGKAVVTELDQDTEIEDDLRTAVLGVGYDALPDACLRLVHDAAARRQLEQQAMAVSMSRSQATFLRDAVARLAQPAAAQESAPLPHPTEPGKNDSPIMQTPDIGIKEMILRRSTPVVINCFNQFTYVKNIVEKLRDAGFGNLYLVDQASTYPPLRDYMAQLVERNAALPLYLPENKGPHHFFLTRLYDIFGGAPFVYTDPDLSWDQLAPDFLTRMFDVGHRYRAFKVGPALVLPNEGEGKPNLLNSHNSDRPKTVAEVEAPYWREEIEPGVFHAPIDTTMHLFIPQYYDPGHALITGLRIAGDGYSLLHLPWFKNDPMPQEEYDYYLQRSSYTTWLPDEGGTAQA